jgi:hypothetical protein
VIPVWFNAWRYEREDHLIVPLLDTLREELERRARSTRADPTTRERAKDAAQAMGRAARAIARGLKLRVGVPFTGIGLDADFKAIEEALAQPPPAGPMSFYHGAFAEMESAVQRFGAGGERRIVVFIDDLDRCLPMSALGVLESMKLFFDFEGFIFVVGLDQDVVQRAIEAKYGLAQDRVLVLAPTAQRGEPDEALQGARADAIGGAGEQDAASRRAAQGIGASEEEVRKLGSEYLKKIFQVPFGLPRISTQQLGRFFKGLLETSSVPSEQQADLRSHVQPHLVHLSGEGAVNPREVKRLINAYTLQMKLLSARRVRGLDPNAVVTLLTMSFRAEWRHLYDLLVADPSGFADALPSIRQSGTVEGVKLWPGDQTVPRDFLEYLDGPGGAILNVSDLAQYVASVEATRTTKRELGPAQSLVVELGGLVGDAAKSGDISSERDRIAGAGERLRDSLTHLPPNLPVVSRIHNGASVVQGEIASAPWEGEKTDVQAWASRTEPVLRAMYDNLRQVRLLTDVGSHA